MQEHWLVDECPKGERKSSVQVDAKKEKNSKGEREKERSYEAVPRSSGEKHKWKQPLTDFAASAN